MVAGLLVLLAAIGPTAAQDTPGGAASPVPAPERPPTDGAPRFSVVVGAVRSGAPAEGHCLGELVPPGLPVALLDADGRTCRARTGPRGVSFAGEPCTSVEVRTCELHDVLIAVVGETLDRIALLRREPLDPRRARAAIAKVDSSDAIAAALAKPEEWFVRPRPVVDPVPSAMFTIEGRSGPVFVRYGARLDGRSVPGPVVVLENGRPVTPFSACAAEPVPFRVGRQTFVKGGSVCCDCGQLRDEVFVVADGALRRIYASDARSQ